MVAVFENEDFLSAGEGDGGCDGHGVCFCAGVGEANEFDAGWREALGYLQENECHDCEENLIYGCS